MRAVLVAAVLCLAALAAVPAASASGVPEPICQIPCMVLFYVVLPCAGAEVQQNVHAQGEGCAIVNAVEKGVGCFVRAAEAQAGLAEPCPA